MNRGKTMSKTMRKAMTLLFAVLLTACGAGQDKTSNQAGDVPMAAKDTVFGADIKALDKARHVQDTVMQDKANVDAAIEAGSSTQSKDSSAE